MARIRKVRNPRSRKYKKASAIDITLETGRAKLWHERLIRAKDMLDIDFRREMRQKAMSYIDGSHGHTSRGDFVYFNEALPALEDVVNGAFPMMPPVEAEARHPEQEQLADMVSALADATLDSTFTGATGAITSAEWNEIEWGIGIVKVRWDESIRDRLYRPTADASFLRPHLMAALAENGEPADALISESDDHGVHIQMHAGVAGLGEHIEQHMARLGVQTWAQPVIEAVRPDRFLYDPDAERWQDREWEAELVDELVIDLQSIEGIKNLNPENLPPVDEFGHDTSNSNQGVFSGQSDFKAADLGDNYLDATFDFEKTRVQAWLIHDRINNGYVILPADVKDTTKPVLETVWPYETDIYNILVHRPVQHQIHGHSTLLLIKPILRELARVNADIRRHNYRASTAKPILAREHWDKQLADELNDPVRPYATAPAAALAMMKDWSPPSTPKELLEFRGTLLAELRRMLGSEAMSQGAPNPHQISATEAGMRGEFTRDRLQRRKQAISELLGWMARTILLLYRDFAEGPLTVRVMGPEGIMAKQLDPAAIPEDIEVRLDVEAVTPEKQQEDLANITQFTQVVTTLLPPGSYDVVQLVMMNGKKLRIRHPERILVTPDEQAMLGGVLGGQASQPAGGQQTIQFPGNQGQQGAQAPQQPFLPQQAQGQTAAG